MEITGKPNLSLVKRALISHTVYCSTRALRAAEKESEELWDPELKRTQELLDSVDINLQREENQEGEDHAFPDYINNKT